MKEIWREKKGKVPGKTMSTDFRRRTCDNAELSSLELNFQVPASSTMKDNRGP